MNDLINTSSRPSKKYMINPLSESQSSGHVSVVPHMASTSDQPKTSMTPTSNLRIYYDKMLGKGSFSKVFPGWYKENIVAVKIITMKHLEKTIALQLKRELQVIRILQEYPHKNIARYYKIFQTVDKMIIVMELCSGGELTKHIKQGLDLKHVRNYFSQILDGYKHLLELNIVHRDIKSANILLSQDKKIVKFIDFGLSKVFSIDLNKTICGSPLYMAPEVLDHRDYDSKSDIWSLGVLLYEMVYGLTPFHKCTVIKTLKQTVQRNAIPYPETSTQGLYVVPMDLITYMRGLLEPDPRRRLDWHELGEAPWLRDEILISTSSPILALNESHVDSDDGLSVSQVEEKLHFEKIKQTDDCSNPDKTKEVSGSDKKEVSGSDKKEVSGSDKKAVSYPEISMLRYELLAKADRDLKHIPKISYVPVICDGHDGRDRITRTEDSLQGKLNPFDNLISDSHIEIADLEPAPIQVHEKRSAPIPIRVTKRSTRRKYHDSDTEYGMSFPTSYTINPYPKGERGESFGDVVHTDLKMDDLSFIENNFSKEYAPLLEQQQKMASGSGLIHIDDVNDILITNVPEKTTTYEYISRGSSIIGSYLYSRSAPIAATVLHGLGRVARTTVGNIAMVTP
jgi:serine/threonine protein kinase